MNDNKASEPAQSHEERRIRAGDDLDVLEAGWTFKSEEVVSAFDEHVRKSVPLYAEGHQLILQMSDFFVDHGSTIFDVGCSTGALTRALYERHRHKKPSVVGVDASTQMIEVARMRDEGSYCTFINGDAREVDMTGSDVIAAYYTIQFVRPYARQQLINQIYTSLRWGGALFMFEKVRAPDARFQDIFSASYIEYKRTQGFSDEEIIGKQMSLKGILEPFSTQGNIDLLERAGFRDIVTIFKRAPFEGFLCVK